MIGSPVCDDDEDDDDSYDEDQKDGDQRNRQDTCNKISHKTLCHLDTIVTLLN